MSYTLSLGQKAPSFSLKGTDDQTHTLDEFKSSKGLVIFFTCNHCPYVKGSNENTRELAKEYQQKGISFIAINSNSAHTYPEDSFDHMKKVMQEKAYPWIYLHDKDQKVAKAYGALKTPHFYLFDEKRALIYTGRAIDYPKDASQAKTHELKEALEAFVNGKKISQPITNPLGCNIKWEGKPAHWMPPEACDLI